jgi:hypothetical protein
MELGEQFFTKVERNHRPILTSTTTSIGIENKMCPNTITATESETKTPRYSKQHLACWLSTRDYLLVYAGRAVSKEASRGVSSAASSTRPLCISARLCVSKDWLDASCICFHAIIHGSPSLASIWDEISPLSSFG